MIEKQSIVALMDGGDRLKIEDSRSNYCQTNSINTLKTNRNARMRCANLGVAENVWKVQSALEDAGIIFIDKDGAAGVGVRLRE